MGNSESILASKKPKTTNPVIQTVIQEEAIKPPVEEMNFELPVVRAPFPRIRLFSSSPPDYDHADYGTEVNMSVFDAEI